MPSAELSLAGSAAGSPRRARRGGTEDAAAWRPFLARVGTWPSPRRRSPIPPGDPRWGVAAELGSAKQPDTCAGVARGVRSSRSAWFLQLPDFCRETGQSARGPCSAGLAFGGLHAATWGPKSPSELSLPLGRPSVGKCRNSVPGLGRSSSHSQSAGEEVHGSLVTVVFAACCVDISGIRCLSRAGALQRRAAPRRDGVCQSPFSWARLCVAAWDTRPLQTCSPCGG